MTITTTLTMTTSRQLSTSPWLAGPQFLPSADEAVKDIPR